MKETGMTDEDRMIARLHAHKNLVTWMLQRLENAGIEAKRTIGNDPGGDIALRHQKDVPRVQEIIRMIQRENNS